MHRHQHNIIDIYMRGTGSAEQHHVGNIVSREWFDALVHFPGAVRIAVEAYDAEFSLHQPWVNGSDAYSGTIQVHLQPLTDGFDGSLGGAIYRAVGVGPVPCDGADVDNVTAITRHH